MISSALPAHQQPLSPIVDQVRQSPFDRMLDPQPQTDILRSYLVARRRAILSELAEIERLLDIRKKTVDKR